MSPSELTNTIEQFIVYVHRNEAHFTYIYVYHTNVSEADNISKKLISPIFLLFLFRSGAPLMTLLTAGALTDPRLPATASNVCTTDARLGGVGRVHPPPPQQNPGYAGDRVADRAFCGKSMKLGTYVHHTKPSKFSYSAKTDFPRGGCVSHFKKWPLCHHIISETKRRRAIIVDSIY